MSRRAPALVVLLVAMAAVVIVARTPPSPVVPVFADTTERWMPAAPVGSELTGSWFCPGVPATGEDGVGGELLISNADDVDVVAQVHWLAPVAAGDTDDGESDVGLLESVTVEARSVVALDVAARRTAPYVSAVVEVEGAGVVVEQRVVHPAGNGVAPCANSTSDTWYFAEGFTVGGSRNEIVLTNPHDDVVIVNVGFATEDGSRAPLELEGIPIGARSMLVIDLGAPGMGAQGEDRLAVRVEATRGRLVAARAQHFLAGGRLGFNVTLGSPALREQWWFADGEKGSGVTERFSIYNPTSSDVEVDVIYLGVPAGADPESVVVPARQVVTFESAQVATLPEGRHATVFSTRADPSVVVERALTRTVDGRPYTSVLMGGPPRADGYVATTWRVVAGPRVPTAGALVVYNVDNSPGTVTVEVVGPDGPVAIPGLADLELPAASIRALDLVDESSLGREIVITSTTRVFVERSLFADGQGGRSSSWALPAG